MPPFEFTPQQAATEEQWQRDFQRLLERMRQREQEVANTPLAAPAPRFRRPAPTRWAPTWMDATDPLQPAVPTPTPEPAPVAAPVQEETEERRTHLANNFLVGCDPEFVILKNGDLVNVARYMGQRGEVGWDHNGSCLELRPKPAMGTLTLVKRIQRLIKGTALQQVAPLGKWRGGAMIRAASRSLTLGGHVHLDVDPPGGYNRAHEEEAVARVKGLDRVTATLEGLDILPLTESKERRARGEYGQFGEIRVYQDGGARPHLEYRTMASWLYHPVTAMVCLTAAKLAAVSPQVAMDTLKPRSICFENLVNFFEFFRHKDLNARNVLEKLVDGNTVKALQKDPDGDLKESWKEIAFA